MPQELSPTAQRLIALLGIGLLAALWLGLTEGGIVSPLFLPSPSSLWDALAWFHEVGWLWPAIGRSSLRVAESLALVTLLGVPLGLAMGTFPAFDALLRTPVLAAKSIPVTGLIGLIILWFSIEERAKIVFLFLGAIFYMILLVRSAALAVRPEYLRVAADLGATRWQQLARIVFPSALPQIWDAIAVSCGLMWTYIVLAEFINSNEEQLGVGYLVYIGSRTQSSAKVFAALLIIAVIAAMTDALFALVRRRVLFW